LSSIYGETVGMIAGYVYFDSDKFVRMDFQAESNLILALDPIHGALKQMEILSIGLKGKDTPASCQPIPPA